MTSHELARQLLERPDLPLELQVADSKDGYVGDLGDVTINIGKVDTALAQARGFHDTKPGDCIVLRAWQSSEETPDEDDED